MNTIIKLILTCSTVALLTSCGDNYEINFPPPKPEVTYREILPVEVGGNPVKGQALSLDQKQYKGIMAVYGTDASLILVQCKDQDAMDSYVKNTVLPRLEDFGSRSSAKIKGVWGLKASGKMGRVYGWQNSNWLFIIQAANDKIFDEAVSKFAFISKK